MIYIVVFIFLYILWRGIKEMMREGAHEVHSFVKDGRSKETVINNWQNVVQKRGLNLSNKPIVYMYFKKGNASIYVPQYAWREGENIALFMDNPQKWLPLGEGWQDLTYEENIDVNYIAISNICRIYRMNNFCHMDFRDNSSFLFRLDSFGVFQTLCPDVI